MKCGIYVVSTFSDCFFLLLASLLWATDGIFRIFAVRKFDALYIILFESMIMALMLLPWLLCRSRREMFRLSMKLWICAAICGVGDSILGTLFFTKSFFICESSVSNRYCLCGAS
jgi:uncharacterized membrane protein